MIYEHKLEMDTCSGDTANVTVEFEADRPSSRDAEVKGIYYLESDEPLDSEDILNMFEWIEQDGSQWQLISHNIR
jgi:hypothetical protein